MYIISIWVWKPTYNYVACFASVNPAAIRWYSFAFLRSSSLSWPKFCIQEACVIIIRCLCLRAFTLLTSFTVISVTSCFWKCKSRLCHENNWWNSFITGYMMRVVGCSPGLTWFLSCRYITIYLRNTWINVG